MDLWGTCYTILETSYDLHNIATLFLLYSLFTSAAVIFHLILKFLSSKLIRTQRRFVKTKLQTKHDVINFFLPKENIFHENMDLDLNSNNVTHLENDFLKNTHNSRKNHNYISTEKSIRKIKSFNLSECKQTIKNKNSGNKNEEKKNTNITKQKKTRHSTEKKNQKNKNIKQNNKNGNNNIEKKNKNQINVNNNAKSNSRIYSMADKTASVKNPYKNTLLRNSFLVDKNIKMEKTKNIIETKV